MVYEHWGRRCRYNSCRCIYPFQKEPGHDSPMKHLSTVVYEAFLSPGLFVRQSRDASTTHNVLAIDIRTP
jgi:hypothetical protein